MFRHAKNLANPFHRAGAYIGPHAVLIAVLLIAAYISGFGSGFFARQSVSWVQRIEKQRAAEHIHSGIVLPTRQVPIAPPTGGGALPSSGGIYFNYFAGTDNQSSLLSCSAMTFAKLLGYEYNRALHIHIRISPRQLYDIDTGGNRGFDGNGVTTSISDYNRIASTNGVVPTSVLSYGPNVHPPGIAPYAVEPVPAYAAHGGQIFSHASVLWRYPGAGVGAVDRTREFIAHHRTVGFGSQWFHNSTRDAWITGKIGLPAPGDWFVYDHSSVVVRYNDSIRMPDGTMGAFLISNSFGKLFGRDKYGNINRGHGGYVWMSYAYFGRYAAFGEVVDLGLPRTGSGHNFPPAVNPNAPTRRAPIDPGPQTGGAVSPYVHGVVLHDTGYDITGLINYWVRYYQSRGVFGMNGAGIVATALTESSLNQIADRCCIPGDTSYGTFQFTLGTACSFGICYDIRNQLDNPVVSVRLAAEYYANTLEDHPAVPFPYQYVFYNAGGGVPDSFAFNPTGTAWSNFQNFLVNWDVALRYYAGGVPAPPAPPPPPKRVVQVFPSKAWCHAYTAWRIKGCPSAYWHGHLGTVPRFWAFVKGVRERLGGVGAREAWHPKRRYMSQRFQHGYSIYSWPTHRGWRPKVAR